MVEMAFYHSMKTKLIVTLLSASGMLKISKFSIVEIGYNDLINGQLAL